MDQVECNICRWRGAGFRSDGRQEEDICPACLSQTRHRLACLALQRDPGLFSRTVAGKVIFHFSPENSLRRFVQPHAKRYVTCDYERDYFDVRLDMADMPAVLSGSLDTIIACDVLEHIPDHLAALREIRRVLKPGGHAILTVPLADAPTATFEDPAAVDAARREAVYGQADHLRLYGQGFAALLADLGFVVRRTTPEDFLPEERDRHVLTPRRPSDHPLSASRAAVFFARKA